MNWANPFLKHNYFKIWTRISKVNIMSGVKGQGHIEEAKTWCTKPWSKMIRQKFKFWNKKKNQHLTQLLKLVDKIYKYEMDPTSIVEYTEQTWFCPQTDGETDKVKPVYHPHPSTLLKRGV